MYNTDCDKTKTRVYHYIVILSRIFQAFSVDFRGERREITGRLYITTFNTFKQYGYA